jgi:hypothetical protein
LGAEGTYNVVLHFARNDQKKKGAAFFAAPYSTSESLKDYG